MEEIHLFVLWPFARREEERILADMSSRVEIVEKIEAGWPDGVDAASGYRRFYGAFLPSGEKKAKNAGAGRFLIVVVRDKSPRYELKGTQRGLERVNVNIFDMKWLYRSWVGGLHRVHGTNSTEEARRDIMLLTGIPLDVWTSGKAKGRAMTVLPGQHGWRSLAELFAFLNETHPYVVLRNSDGLPDSFDPIHEDVDLLAANAKECAGLLAATKSGRGAQWSVKVAGENAKFDIRGVGDGYYDEDWQTDIISTRELSPAGVYRPSPGHAFHSLLYHVLYQKHCISPDYPSRLARLAVDAGIKGATLEEWLGSLEDFLSFRHYSTPDPKDSTVTLDRALLSWHGRAREAERVCTVNDVRPRGLACRLRRDAKMVDLVFSAKQDGRDVSVRSVRAGSDIARSDFDGADAFSRHAGNASVKPLYWHVARKGAFIVEELVPGTPLSRILQSGSPPQDVTDRVASALPRIASALEAAGLVHRDVKPENILVADDGTVRLVGFGFSVRRSKYTKEPPTIRKRALECLAPLGGDCVLRPGVWDDVASCEAVLKLLPETAEVRSAMQALSKMKHVPMRVRLPVSTRAKLFMKWLGWSLFALVAPKARSVVKRSRARRFAAAAAGF